MTSHDLIVIGSGPAGEKGAVQAAYFGKRVALIERELPHYGGACTNTGTLPSKTLRESALALTGMTSRGLEAATGNSAGVQISWRHGTDENPRGNVVFFDGHAVTLDPREVTSQKAFYDNTMSASDRMKLTRYWDADGDGDYLTPRQ